jgi:hypothetical protein
LIASLIFVGAPPFPKIRKRRSLSAERAQRDEDEPRAKKAKMDKDGPIKMESTMDDKQAVSAINEDAD